MISFSFAFGTLVVCFVVLLVIQDIAHSRERRDLYNRLMARDYIEYNKHNGEEKKKTKRSNNPLKDKIEKDFKKLAHGDDTDERS